MEMSLRLLRFVFGSRAGVIALVVLLAGTVAVVDVVRRSQRQLSVEPGHEIVIIGFGGSYGDALRAAVIEPFQKETGVPVRYEETCCVKVGPTLGEGDFAGDLVAGVDLGGLLSWSGQGYLLDDPRLTGLVERRAIPGRYRHPGVLVISEYAYVIAAHGKDAVVPGSWAEFWDTVRYPGTRILSRSTPSGQLEAALLADGVRPSLLYPLDVERALTSLDRLRARVPVLFANSPSDLMNMIARGDGRYAIAFSNRLEVARREGLPVSFTYAQCLRTGNGFGLLKGARQIDSAVAFLELASRPEVLGRFLTLAGLLPTTSAGGSGPASNAVHEGSDLALDPMYWGEHRAQVGEHWVRWLVQ
jgi:putative spermidine/putrescine transport system substrate-binding protein